MKLDEHGKQKHMGQTLTPQELHHTLTKGKARNGRRSSRQLSRRIAVGCVCWCARSATL